MALLITQDCINCEICQWECDQDAISLNGSIHVIDPDKCTECIGFHAEPQCVLVCAVDCIVPDPDRPNRTWQWCSPDA